MNGLTILLEPTDQNVSLEVDPVQFRTVLTNLFENARKYVDRNDKQVVVSYEVVENSLSCRSLITAAVFRKRI